MEDVVIIIIIMIKSAHTVIRTACPLGNNNYSLGVFLFRLHRDDDGRRRGIVRDDGTVKYK